MKGPGIFVLLLCIFALACADSAGAAQFTGLWVGAVRIDKVSESQIPANPEFTNPQPTGYPFTFRIIIHVNTTGNTVRLLKDVIQMEKIGSPGQLALITDDLLIPNYTCPEENGDKFCRRIGATAYDFTGLEAAMTGSFSLTGTLSSNIILTPDNPTNPFKHKFSPDHDNLDELGFPITNPVIMEVYNVTRDMTLQFSATDPLGINPPGWGTTIMGGTYNETLNGVHRNPIYVSGAFRLQKVTDTGELNQ